MARIAGVNIPTNKRVVIALTFVFGTQDYLGLGVLSPHPGAPTLPGFFVAGPDRWRVTTLSPACPGSFCIRD